MRGGEKEREIEGREEGVRKEENEEEEEKKEEEFEEVEEGEMGGGKEEKGDAEHNLKRWNTRKFEAGKNGKRSTSNQSRLNNSFPKIMTM